MKKLIFRGIATALITPFTNGEVDFPTLRNLTFRQLTQGIDALVVGGSTGEPMRLSDTQLCAVITCVCTCVQERLPVIVGAGGRDLAGMLHIARHAAQSGAKAFLAVAPSDSEKTQKGQIAAYWRLADACPLPVLLYHVPARTGVTFTAETCAILATHPNIVGIKEASGELFLCGQMMAYCRGGLALYAGNDRQILPVLTLGGAGAVSVVSNLLPQKTTEIARRYFSSDLCGAARVQEELRPFVEALDYAVNPIPIKAALAAAGLLKTEYAVQNPEKDAYKEPICGREPVCG